MLKYLKHDTRETWLADRTRGIGASEAAAIYGVSRWSDPVRLWEIKCGIRQAKDLSGIDYVEAGHRVEGPLGDLFAALHPEYALDKHPYDMLYQSERPWLYATLDGELTQTDNGAKGILEIKKHEILGRRDLREWDGRIPSHYYTQVCHQFLATGFSFAWLWALLIFWDGRQELRPYYFLPEECSVDMELLLESEVEFWNCVQERRRPAAILAL